MSANGKLSLCGFARGTAVFKRNLQTSCFLIMFENMIARILLKRFFPFCLFFVFWSACSTDTVSAKDDVSVSSSSENSPSGISSAGNSSSSAENDQPKDSCQGTPGIPWDGTTAKFFACGAGTKRSPYIILTAEQLAKLSFAIGAGDKDFNGKYFRLEADILLNEGEVIDSKGALVGDSAALHKWTPIGNSNISFSGFFDGNHHSIRGIFIHTTSSHNGLFGSSSGTIANVSVENSWIHGGKYTAGIVGMLKGDGIVRNATNSSSIIGAHSVAGIVGETDYAYNKITSIDSVSNVGVITGSKYVAGIVGYADHMKLKTAKNEGYIEGDYGVGGIAGHLGYNTVAENLWNYGNVQGKEYTAGIVSFQGISYPSNRVGTLALAKNFGKISGTKYTAGVVGENAYINIQQVSNSGVVEGEIYVGGISGHSKNSTTSSLYNLGEISGTSYVGGIIGYNQEGVTSSAYNAGEIVGDSLTGLVIGVNYNTTMADYYYLEIENKEPFGLNNGGGVATAISEREMKSAKFAERIGEDFIYSSDKNDGYPALSFE